MLVCMGLVRRGRWLAVAAVVVLSLGCTPAQRTGPVERTPDSPEAPSSDLIAFVSGRDGSDALFLPQAAGGLNPAWSSDGSQLAFNVVTSTGFDIEVIASSGDDRRSLLATDASEERPRWSPDCTQLTHLLL